MALAETSFLYRVRIVFEPDGKPSLVETVHKDAITRDGVMISATERVKTYTSAKMAGAVASLLREIERVGTEDDAEAARRKATEEAERAAAEAARKA